MTCTEHRPRALIRRGATCDRAALVELLLCARASRARDLQLPCAQAPDIFFRELAQRAAEAFLSSCETWVVAAPEVVAFLALRDNRIAALMTAPERRRRGFARRLVDKAMERHDTIVVRIDRDHDGVVFLRRHGFAVDVIHVDPATRAVEYAMSLSRASA